MTENANVN